MKSCAEEGVFNNCQHKVMACLGIECNYIGYCDFERPRDSRNITLQDSAEKENQGD